MAHDPQQQDAAELDEAGLPGLVQRTCQALQAMAASLEALDSVLLRLARLGPSDAAPTEVLTGTRVTVSRVVALLRQEVPALLFRAQTLRLRLQPELPTAGSSASVTLRMLQADLDGLVAFRMEDHAHWGAAIRRMRANTIVLLAEFDGHRRRLMRPGASPLPATLEAPLPATMMR